METMPRREAARRDVLENDKNTGAGQGSISEARKESMIRYQRQNLRQFVIRLNRKYDADLIEWLENKPSTQGFIIDLIREYYDDERAFYDCPEEEGAGADSIMVAVHDIAAGEQVVPSDFKLVNLKDKVENP